MGFLSKTRERNQEKLCAIRARHGETVTSAATIDILPKFSRGRAVSLCLTKLQKRKGKSLEYFQGFEEFLELFDVV